MNGFFKYSWFFIHGNFDGMALTTPLSLVFYADAVPYLKLNIGRLIAQWPALDHRRAIRNDFQPFSASPHNISKTWSSKPSKEPKLGTNILHTPSSSIHNWHQGWHGWHVLSETPKLTSGLKNLHISKVWCQILISFRAQISRVDLAQLLLTGSGCRCWCFFGPLAEPHKKNTHQSSRHTHRQRKGMFLWSCIGHETHVRIP